MKPKVTFLHHCSIWRDENGVCPFCAQQAIENEVAPPAPAGFVKRPLEQPQYFKHNGIFIPAGEIAG